MAIMTVVPNLDGSKEVRIQGIETPIFMDAPPLHIAAFGLERSAKGPTSIDYMAAALAG